MSSHFRTYYDLTRYSLTLKEENVLCQIHTYPEMFLENIIRNYWLKNIQRY